jgi:hypothetical protein
MFFSLTAGLNGDMWCSVNRFEYPQGSTQAQSSAAIATPRRETFCQADGESAGDHRILSSRSFEHHGLQGALCSSTYTDNAAERPGKVESKMILSAPHAMYQLACIVEDESQFDAEGDWFLFWAERVGHMQESFQPRQ